MMSLWLLRFLKWICPAGIHEEIEGDVIQRYHVDVKRRSKLYANWRMLLRVLTYLRPGILLRRKYAGQTRWAILLRTHVFTAWRHMQKNKLFASINILTLSVSVGACLLIFQYASFELSYDRHYANAENIYRVSRRTIDTNGFSTLAASTPIDLHNVVRESITGIDASAMFVPTSWWFDCSFTYYGDQARTFNETNVSYASSDVLSVFDYEILEGDPHSVLKDPFTIVITYSVAKKYFGDENPIGKVLHLRGSSDVHDYTVTGIMADPPLNAHFYYNMLMSASSLDGNPNREFMGAYLYMVINNPSAVSDVEQNLTGLASNFVDDNTQRIEAALERITDIHLNSVAEEQPSATGDVQSIYFLLSIAFLVLVLAWINYTNLSMASAFTRAKEVGIRKTSGATRTQIVNQFVVETLLTNVLSIGVALVLVFAFAPWFYRAVGISFPWNRLYWLDAGSTGWMVLVTFSLGVLVSAFLPARLMAGVSPSMVLKGKISGVASVTWFRKGAVVFQFICTIGLITMVVGFNRQFNLIGKQDLGIDITRTMMVKSPTNADSAFRTQLGQFRNALAQQSIVENVFTASGLFHHAESWTGDVRRHTDDAPVTFNVNIIDPDFLEGFHLELLAGRNLEVSDYPGDQFGRKIEPLILNETGVRRLGFQSANEAIGEQIFWGDNRCRIAGVVKDFRQHSVRQPIGPAFYTANNGSSLLLQLTVSAADENPAASIVTIHREWNKFFPDNAFDFTMLADEYDNLYTADQRVKNLFEMFCALALIISCLGLFGLSLFALNQRAREMSIRKVLGAPVYHLLKLLTTEYVVMVVAAAVVGLPVAWWILERWLSNFAVRVPIEPWMLIVPVVIALAFAILSTGIQTLRMARRNPVSELRA